jgi:hypothetical protein
VKADVSRPADLERGVERVVGAGGAMLSANARRIADLAMQHRLPAIYWAPWFVEAGGLAAYSPDYVRDDASRGLLRRPDPEGRAPAQVRPRRQHQDRESPRSDDARISAPPRGRVIE